MQKIDLRIYSADGRRVKVLLSRKLKRGIYRTNWHANRSGIYFVVLKGDNKRKVKKIMVIK